MMSDEELKKEAEKTMKITEGKVRGGAILTHFHYIQEKKGEKGVKMVLEKLKELGHPLELKKIKQLEWYPAGLADLVIVVAKEVFSWSDQDIFDMGNNAPKYSFIVRLLMKYFLSLKKTFEESPKFWKKHFTSGTLEAHEYNGKEKYVVTRLKHQCHPIICTFYAGYFLRIAQYCIKNKEVTIQETKCMSKGDPYHEFVTRWK